MEDCVNTERRCETLMAQRKFMNSALPSEGGRENQRAGTAVISLSPVAVPGKDPRPSQQTVPPVPGTVFRGREVRAEAILSAPAVQ